MFRTICTFLSVIGKRFQDAGLRDVMIESGVISEGSVFGVRTIRLIVLFDFTSLCTKLLRANVNMHHTNSGKSPKFVFFPTFIFCSPICPNNFGVVFL